MDTSGSLRRYQYRPLESYTTIRVLVLQPAEDLDTPLKAELMHMESENLLLGSSSPGYYDAVSYCWGDPALSHVLHVDEDSTLGITVNADTMLRHLRSLGKPRYLWIDAICLNQEDREEKQIQVQLMGRIYAQAAKVRVWVGTATLDQHVPQLFSVLKSLASRLKSKEASEATEIERTLESICGVDWKQTLSHFFARPYFLRRWILQEVALGHHITMHCGQSKLSWQWFIQGVKGLQSAIAAGLHLDPKVEATLDTILAIENSNSYKLLDLLWRFHQSQCSVPQDKVFALFGLARDAEEITEVDYSRHWSETFAGVAAAYFQLDKKSIWLHLAHFGSLSGTDPTGIPYPSWIPNWNNSRSHVTMTPDHNAALLSFNGFEYSSFLYVPDLWMVEVDCFYAGRVENISEQYIRPDKGPKQQGDEAWDENKLHAISEVLLAFFKKPDGSPTEQFKQAMRAHEMQLDNDLRYLRGMLLRLFRGKPDTGRRQAVVSSILHAIWNEYDILHIHGKRDAIGVGRKGTQDGDVLVVPPQGLTKVATNSVYWPYKGHPLFGIIVRPASEDLPTSGHTQDRGLETLHDCRYVSICAFTLWKQDCEDELDNVWVQLV